MVVLPPHDMKKKCSPYSLATNALRKQKLAEYELACDWRRFCHNTGMTIKKDRFALIANAVANATKVAPQFQGLLEELKAEKLAEEFTLEHGTQHASKQDIEQEFVSLDAVESDKDEIDENDEEQIDMDCVSSSFADLFDTIES